MTHPDEELQIGPLYLVTAALLLFSTLFTSLLVFNVEAGLAVRNGLLAIFVFQLILFLSAPARRLFLRSAGPLNTATRNFLRNLLLTEGLIIVVLSFRDYLI